MHARLSILFLLLFSGSLVAQSPITFTGRDAAGGGYVALDSVYVRSASGAKDTTLIGSMSLAMDWLTGVHETVLQPEGISLGAPHPNAFESQTFFEVGLDRRASLLLEVFNALGVRTAAFERVFEPGSQRFVFAAAGLPPGVYVLRVSNGIQVRTQKLLKLGASSSEAPSLRWAGPASLAPGHAARGATTLQAPVYTFIGYAHGFLPDTIAQVTPAPGQSYEFSLLPQPDTRKIRSGRLIDEGRTTVPTGGLVVQVNREGSPINGLSISVPANSYTSGRDFSVGYAAVEGHDLGHYFNPISPLITIGNGGGYSEQVMKITIPIQRPAGHFVMVWLYNERTGEIEALPPLEQDDHSITVMTRHFSTSAVTALGKRQVTAESPVANLIATSILESVLAGQSVISTGFTPAKDDWEFVNHGSSLAPKGHCAGQSITAMWYYYEKRLNASPPLPPLYHAYDKVNLSREVLWMDNPDGYRFASVIQTELDFNGRLALLLWEGRDSRYQSLGWRAFAAAMLVTGCPQYVGLTHLKTDGSPDGGHAIIAYKMSPMEGKLYVADPNYPGEERTITFNSVAGVFTPYSTKQNADEPDERAYQNIGFTAKTALIEWDRISARWPEFLDNTIGSKGTPAFPVCGINQVRDNGVREQIDPEKTITTMQDFIEFEPQAAGFTLFGYLPDGNRAEPNRPVDWKIPLQSGENTLGLYTDQAGKFVDFVWLTVKREGYGSANMHWSKIDGSYRRDYVDYQGKPVTENFEQNVPCFGYPISRINWQSYSGGRFSFDTTVAYDNLTWMVDVGMKFDEKEPSIPMITYNYHYVQGQDWEETLSITFTLLPHDPAASREGYTVFQVGGAEVCGHISDLTHVFSRLDRDYTEMLKTYSCGENSLVRVDLNK